MCESKYGYVIRSFFLGFGLYSMRCFCLLEHPCFITNNIYLHPKTGIFQYFIMTAFWTEPRCG